jgi:hypothetical protein
MSHNGEVLSELIPIFGFQVVINVGHELIQAGSQVGLLVWWLRHNDLLPQLQVHLLAAAAVTAAAIATGCSESMNVTRCAIPFSALIPLLVTKRNQHLK